ncbi:MAG: calcium/sodium antiporter [Thermoplasmatota archaeon]
MSLILDAVLFSVGLGLLIFGADGLVRGGSSVANRFGISPLVIGLTIVSFGTSAPELVVSGVASYKGDGEIALGNVLGSNLLNGLIVLGATAMLCPILVREKTIRRDIPLVVLVTALAWFFASSGTISRLEGFLLVSLVVPYLWMLYQAERGAPQEKLPSGPVHAAVIAIVAGVALLVIGGQFVVDHGSAIAAEFGVSDRVIALTLVAMGTSAPELATGLVAAYRREVDLAVGNVVGSNMLNLLLILGLSAVIRPIGVVASALRVDFPILLAATAFLLPLTWTGRRIHRWEGIILIGAYLAYVVFLLLVTG